MHDRYVNNRRFVIRGGLFGLILLAATVCITAPGFSQEDRPAPKADAGDVVSSVAAAADEGGVGLGGLVTSLTIFALAVFVGFEVITKVPPTLHTPLMSGSNAISGITLVGALIAAGAKEFGWVALLGTVAVAMATVNVVGGFFVTHRMLSMFKKK